MSHWADAYFKRAAAAAGRRVATAAGTAAANYAINRISGSSSNPYSARRTVTARATSRVGRSYRRRSMLRRRRSYRRRPTRRYRKYRGRRTSYRRTRTGSARKYTKRSKATKTLNRFNKPAVSRLKRKRGPIRNWLPPSQVKTLEVVDSTKLVENANPYLATGTYDPITVISDVALSTFDRDFNTSAGTPRNWKYLNLCHIRRVANSGVETAGNPKYRRTSRRIRVVDAKLMMELHPSTAEGTAAKTVRIHYMLCKMLENPNAKDVMDNDISIGVAEELAYPGSYPYNKMQKKMVSDALDLSNGIRMKILETGYKTYKGYPKDRNGNEQDAVYRWYFPLNKHMKGIEITYESTTTDWNGAMPLVDRNGFYLFLFAEDRSHSKGGALGDFGTTKPALAAANDWSLNCKYRIRWMDVEDNVNR